MKKDGFTLIEILVVIAILTVLVTLVVPRVIDYFFKSKKEAFIIEVGKLYSETKKEMDTAAIRNQKFTGVNSIKGPKLDLLTNSLDYCIEVKDGVITSVKAYNDEFYIETTASYDEFNDEVTIDDIKEHSKTYTCD